MFLCSFFFFNDTATTEIYTLSLHDALPILFETAAEQEAVLFFDEADAIASRRFTSMDHGYQREANAVVNVLLRSEEHTSELQSRQYLVCRLLLEKKKRKPQCQRYYINRKHK